MAGCNVLLDGPLPSPLRGQQSLRQCSDLGACQEADLKTVLDLRWPSDVIGISQRALFGRHVNICRRETAGYLYL